MKKKLSDLQQGDICIFNDFLCVRAWMDQEDSNISPWLVILAPRDVAGDYFDIASMNIWLQENMEVEVFPYEELKIVLEGN